MMNIEELLLKNKLLEEENKKLLDELQTTKEHLKTYTAPSRSKTYYENHKEEIKQKVNEYTYNRKYLCIFHKNIKIICDKYRICWEMKTNNSLFDPLNHEFYSQHHV